MGPWRGPSRWQVSRFTINNLSNEIFFILLIIFVQHNLKVTSEKALVVETLRKKVLESDYLLNTRYLVSSVNDLTKFNAIPAKQTRANSIFLVAKRNL
jgi:hypothetical protein